MKNSIVNIIKYTLLSLLNLIVFQSPTISAPTRPIKPQSLLSARLRLVKVSGYVVTSATTGRYDFGSANILDKPQVQQVFFLRNDGERPLTLQPLEPTCGFLTATIEQPHVQQETSLSSRLNSSSLTISPKQEISLRIHMDLRGLPPGPQQKLVSVFIKGDTTAAVTLEMSGTILPCIAFAPASVDFGQANAGEERVVNLSLSMDARLIHDGKFPPLVATNPAVRLRSVVQSKATETKKYPNISFPTPSTATMHHATYAVMLAKGAPIGPILGQIQFEKTTLSSLTYTPTEIVLLQGATVPLIGHVIGDVIAQPSLLIIGVVAANQGATRSLIIKAKNANLLQDAQVISDSPWVSARLVPVETTSTNSRVLDNHSSKTLEVTVSPNSPTGVLEVQVAIILSSGQQLQVPVRAFVEARERK